MTTAHALLEARIERNPRYTTNRVTPTNPFSVYLINR